MNWGEGQFILIDKPKTWTSFDVVAKIRNHLKGITGQKIKVGHAGTLDPLATGLLILASGKFTKKIDEIQSQNKVYEGVIEIGKTTPSYDLETEVDSEVDVSTVTTAAIEQAKCQLTGEIEQFPPTYSAVRIDGVRAYKKARKKEEIKMRPREVTVYSFDLMKKELPEIHFRIACSKGTYIRSIANDFGKLLGVGAYLKELRRTEIGDFKSSEAFTIESFIETHPAQ
ncbi:MAG: tRNA pseudouridine(55) synthase TruB [Cytophagales bacterium]|nr:tRNA pseudouridine(55) synthase TruB [Cytophagales bacterium]